MAKRMIVMLLVVAACLTGLGVVKFQQIQAAVAAGEAFAAPPEAVTTIVAREEQWRDTITAIGTVAAVQGVTVSADLPGTVERILFESGQAVRAGAVLAVRAGAVLAVLDTRQERAQLAALEAQHELAQVTFERMQRLLEERVISRAEFDRASADYRQSEARRERFVRSSSGRRSLRRSPACSVSVRSISGSTSRAGIRS